MSATPIDKGMQSSQVATPQGQERPTPSVLSVDQSVANNQPNDRHKLEVADVLLAHGLWATRRDHRESLASDLVAAGFDSAGIGRVCASIMSMAADKRIACGELVNILRDHARLRAAIEDLRRVVEPGRKPHPGEADRERTAQALRDERATWVDADRAHYIRCRRADGIPEDVAAAEWAAQHRHR
jgi:hypothetical protein